MVDKEGNMSAPWQKFFKSAYSQMSNNFNQKGTHLPTISAGELGDNSNGTTYYNKNSHRAEIIINGKLHKIETTPL
jgi:hypothetical protein